MSKASTAVGKIKIYISDVLSFKCLLNFKQIKPQGDKVIQEQCDTLTA